jgi:hypothetical protein
MLAVVSSALCAILIIAQIFHPAGCMKECELQNRIGRLAPFITKYISEQFGFPLMYMDFNSQNSLSEFIHGF